MKGKIAIKLENGDIMNEDTVEKQLKIQQISDFYITRFSNITFFKANKIKKYDHDKAGEDYINIELPDYIKKESIKISV